MRIDGTNSAPVLTSLDIIHWWQAHGSENHERSQRALQAHPEYRLAQLTECLLREGNLSDWATDRRATYPPLHTRVPEIGGLGMD